MKMSLRKMLFQYSYYVYESVAMTFGSIYVMIHNAIVLFKALIFIYLFFAHGL